MIFFFSFILVVFPPPIHPALLPCRLSCGGLLFVLPLRDCCIWMWFGAAETRAAGEGG